MYSWLKPAEKSNSLLMQKINECANEKDADHNYYPSNNTCRYQGLCEFLEKMFPDYNIAELAELGNRVCFQIIEKWSYVHGAICGL
jgi:hypothetical protein